MNETAHENANTRVDGRTDPGSFHVPTMCMRPWGAAPRKRQSSLSFELRGTRKRVRACPARPLPGNCVAHRATADCPRRASTLPPTGTLPQLSGPRPVASRFPRRQPTHGPWRIHATLTECKVHSPRHDCMRDPGRRMQLLHRARGARCAALNSQPAAIALRVCAQVKCMHTLQTCIHHHGMGRIRAVHAYVPGA